jgi:hypothetical protein
MRNVLRRLVPRRVRWLVRVVFRLLTGYYVRSALAEWRNLSALVKDQSTKLEAQSEVLYLLLRRLRTLERSLDELPASTDEFAVETSNHSKPGGIPAERAPDPHGPMSAIKEPAPAGIAAEVRAAQGSPVGRLAANDDS